MKNKILSNFYELFKLDVKKQIEYKSAFYFDIIASILRFFVIKFLWEFIFKLVGESTIRGFMLEEMIFYVACSFACIPLLRIHAVQKVEREIQTSKINVWFTKPINYLNFIKMSSITISFFYFCINFSFFLILAYIFLPSIQISILNILMFLVMSIAIYFVILNIKSMVALIAFWTTSVWGINYFVTQIIFVFSGGLVPLTFFPDNVVTILKYLPFYYMNYSAVSILLFGSDLNFFIKSISILLIFGFIVRLLLNKFYKHAIKKLDGLGG